MLNHRMYEVIYLVFRSLVHSIKDGEVLYFSDQLYTMNR